MMRTMLLASQATAADATESVATTRRISKEWWRPAWSASSEAIPFTASTTTSPLSTFCSKSLGHAAPLHVRSPTWSSGGPRRCWRGTTVSETTTYGRTIARRSPRTARRARAWASKSSPRSLRPKLLVRLSWASPFRWPMFAKRLAKSRWAISLTCLPSTKKRMGRLRKARTRTRTRTRTTTKSNKDDDKNVWLVN